MHRYIFRLQTYINFLFEAVNVWPFNFLVAARLLFYEQVLYLFLCKTIKEILEKVHIINGLAKSQFSCFKIE
ncbi:MAG: hypothetical protein DSY76_02830 [Bacteroidetes bacterium]|nr:MAG: hypothetical protein DSY76_02830 [Bacteroidota bacterium]